MDRNNTIRRTLTAAGRLALCAASALFTFTLPAQATQLDEHNDLIETYVNQMHADPLVADCAAHGNFVAGTSTVLDHVEFTSTSFDSSHAKVTPWNDSFDEGKQRVKVDTIVTVDGTGIPKDSNDSPYDLKFRCGYVGNQMLAFSWNDPVPPARARSEGGSSVRGRHGAHGKGGAKKKSSGKISKKPVSGALHHKAPATGTGKTTAAKVSARTGTKKTASTPKKPAA